MSLFTGASMVFRDLVADHVDIGSLQPHIVAGIEGQFFQFGPGDAAVGTEIRRKPGTGVGGQRYAAGGKNFIEEAVQLRAVVGVAGQRNAFVRGLEPANLVVDCSNERPPYVSEQFTLEKRFG